MKKLFLVLMTILTISVTTAPNAQETTQWTVGVKGWNTPWTRSFPDGREDLESDTTLLIGPTIGFRSGDVFGGLTYASGTFDFSDKNILISGFDFRVETESERTDLDFVVGRSLDSTFGLLLGYKKSDVTFKTSIVDISGVEPILPTVETKLDTELSGPVIGVNFNYPMGQSRGVFFGNISYLLLEYEEPGFQEDTPSIAYELAVAYPLEEKPIVLTIGYKSQEFEGDESEITDEFSGLTFGANYRF